MRIELNNVRKLSNECTVLSETDYDLKLDSKTWIQYIIRAIEEDLGKTATKCGNIYCRMIKQITFYPQNNNERNINGKKKWLCDRCVVAYDHSQYCEFCNQIYLNDTWNNLTLDGKEWAQCESVNCNSWAHVECLQKAYDKTREEVIAEEFKYICCRCKTKENRKRKMSTV